MGTIRRQLQEKEVNNMGMYGDMQETEVNNMEMYGDWCKRQQQMEGLI